MTDTLPPVKETEQMDREFSQGGLVSCAEGKEKRKVALPAGCMIDNSFIGTS
jgi:hypothetical protein